MNKEIHTEVPTKEVCLFDLGYANWIKVIQNPELVFFIAAHDFGHLSQKLEKFLTTSFTQPRPRNFDERLAMMREWTVEIPEDLLSAIHIFLVQDTIQNAKWELNIYDDPNWPSKYLVI